MSLRAATRADFDQIVGSLSSFWGGSDVRKLHHPMFVEGFRETAIVYPDARGRVAAYLFGLVAPTAAVGFVHLAAVRDTERQRGLGRLLYSHFGELVAERGCSWLKATPSRSNERAIAFHRALGMEEHGVTPDEDRVVMLGPAA